MTDSRLISDTADFDRFIALESARILRTRLLLFKEKRVAA
jgi:hypothetical protein